MSKFLVTTIDNPYNPFTEFDKWNEFDVSKGYNTCSYLARIANTSPELSDSENEVIINDAVNEICRLNILGIYKKVTLEDSKDEENPPKNDKQDLEGGQPE